MIRYVENQIIVNFKIKNLLELEDESEGEVVEFRSGRVN